MRQRGRAVGKREVAVEQPVKAVAAAPARISGRAPAGLLAVCACLLLLTVVFYAFVQPQIPVRMARSSSQLIGESPWWRFVTSLPLPVPSGPVAIAWSLFAVNVVVFGAYSCALVACWHLPADARRLAAVVAVALGGLVLSVLALPNQNGDLYDYIVQGRVAAAHGENLYYTEADAFPNDPLYPVVSGQFTADPELKPPAWGAIEVALAAAGGDVPATAVMRFRLGLAAFTAAALGLVIAALRRRRPGHVMAGAVLFGWNPIILVHGAAKADVTMVVFVVLAAALLSNGRRVLAAVPLTLSVLVEAVTVPLLAIYFVSQAMSRRWAQVGAAVVVAGGVTVALYAPFRP